MYKEISSFIDPAIELEIGKDKWGTFKENELNFDSNPLIITSKSCRKFISDIDSELIIEVNSEPSFETINESYKKISKKLPNLINKENIFREANWKFHPGALKYYREIGLKIPAVAK